MCAIVSANYLRKLPDSTIYRSWKRPTSILRCRSSKLYLKEQVGYNSQIYYMKHLNVSKFIFFLFLIGTAIFIYFACTKAVLDWPAWSSLIFTLSIAFFKMLYHSWARFYLFIHQVTAKILNYSTTWDLIVEFEGEVDKPLDVILASIKGIYPKVIFVHNSDNKKIVNVGKYNIELRTFTEPDPISSITENSYKAIINIRSITVPYRQVERTLDREITPFFLNCERSLKVKNSKYVFQLQYDKVNPFWGLYIKKLPSGALKNLKCEILESFKDYPVWVTIEAYTVEFVSASIANLLAVSRRYLSLSSPTQSR